MDIGLRVERDDLEGVARIGIHGVGHFGMQYDTRTRFRLARNDDLMRRADIGILQGRGDSCRDASCASCIGREFRWNQV
ncbi:MAG: hypothetical protein F4Z15_00865 [Gammaproteobacteria bacterium]|nr:hypothetical protein [Gammaproteobacteria bacterium]MYD75951.1 hypothetical protein [Gammaproteobacteria bacterium]MYJ52809.1 hypothetical protein [Gammaproteobacteria bacterium]